MNIGVGKSCILQRFTNNSFYTDYISTIGVDFGVRTLPNVEGNNLVKFQIWDTSGLRRFETITRSYYRGCAGICIIYDVTNRGSFLNVRDYWISDIRDHGRTDIQVILVANKSDLSPDRWVSIWIMK